MTVPDEHVGLRFACDCVSARRGVCSDPWAGVAKNKLLMDGTKEEIINLVADEPRTISQLAEALSLSPPSVHAHIGDMMRSELLRESEEWEKQHPTERYYEPNFPVVKADEQAEFEKLCGEMAAQVADLFTRRQPQLQRAFARTDLAARGWNFADVAHYLYARVQREARTRLEGSGMLPPPCAHRNGADWVFWAEQPAADEGAS
ncbi:MAG: winged helix-turn-helix domain-containing protein [Pyrinomonadaceae bacterium]